MHGREKSIIFGAPCRGDCVSSVAALPQVDGVPMKNSQAVDFQEQLNLGPFMAPAALDGGPAWYRLYGIIVHEGTRNSPHSGHYVAYVRGADGQWWECNDAQVGHLPKLHYPFKGTNRRKLLVLFCSCWYR